MHGGVDGADLLGRYRLLERLGSGASAVVYRALDTSLNREVALKVLAADRVTDEGAHRLRAEARLLARLNHPNVEIVYEAGRDRGQDFLAVELVPGPSLAELAAQGPLSEAQVRDLGRQLAEGLAAAHARGVVHCDLKPANLRLTAEGRLKILDFGIARLRQELLSATLSTLERPEDTFAVAGTPAYMAPEQLEGRADERTDVYAAGAVLYELATGRRPFERPTVTALLHAVAAADPVPARTHNRALSPGLEAVIDRALQKDPAARFPNALAFKQALETQGGRLRPGRRLRRVGFTAGVAVLVGLVGVGLVRAYQAARAFGDAPVPVIRERRLTAYPDDFEVEALFASPDGREFVYGLGGQAVRRRFEEGPPEPVPTPAGCSAFIPRGLLADGTLAGDCAREGERGEASLPVRLGGEDGWEPLAERGTLTNVAPDGRHLQLRRDSNILVLDLDEGRTRRVLSLGPTEWAPCSGWSPDSRHLAVGVVEATDGGHESRVEIVTVDGDQRHVVPVERLLQPASVCGLAWTSDDRLLFAASDEAGSGSELWSVGIARGAWDQEPAQRLHAWPYASVEGLQWTDGRLLYIKRAGGQTNLRIFDVRPGVQRLEEARIAAHSDSHEAGVWTPDGRIYFQSNRYGTWDAFVQAPEDPEPQVVAGGPDDEFFDAPLQEGRFLFWRVDRREAGDGSPCRLMEAPSAGAEAREIGIYGEAYLGLPGMQALCPTVWCPRGDPDRCLLLTFERSDMLFQPIDLDSGALAAGFRRPTPTTTSHDLSPEGDAIVLTPPDRPAIGILSLETGETLERKVRMPAGFEDTALLDAAWAQDGTGWFAVTNTRRPKHLVFVDARTHEALVVVHSETPEFMRWPWPSPDGRHLVVTTYRYDVDVWMLEGLGL